MSALDAKKSYNNLKNKGFEVAYNKSNDHKRLDFFHNGKWILCTKISHSNDDIRDALIHQMAHQCKLSKTDFMNLCNCPLSREEYLKKLENLELLE